MKEEAKAEKLALDILKYARNELLLSFRFMDLALCKLTYIKQGFYSFGTDGKHLYYQKEELFSIYKEKETKLNHMYLHSVLHCVLYHPFFEKKEDQALWDLACDIAVESIILDFSLPQLEVNEQDFMKEKIHQLEEEGCILTPQQIYHKFLKEGLSQSEKDKWTRLFTMDSHDSWNGHGNSNSNNDQIRQDWQWISQRMKVDMETLSRDCKEGEGRLNKSLIEVNREKYDYSEFLRKFAVETEEMKVSQDEFDYIFYTYGLQLYEKVPLIEPLEYSTHKKIKDFVIAIDTSGSVAGDLVKSFLNKTYNILSQMDNFFSKIQIHMIQCDSKVQEDTIITCKEELEELSQKIEVKGLGFTDFRPVFSYIEELRRQGELENLKGMLYFTDGKGIFPERKPGYEVAFVFTKDEEQVVVPTWAMKVIFDEE